ncbi:hypothetical protein ACIGEZ_20320 [Streptomyces sp. NPDC085481]|uniref:hypothetical protein n=1 Tax=Streptomyces sp. NPDC085481 TaxID=3365727 RepID=UPI0037D82BF9
MHATRTKLRILAGVAMAALSGCVAVQPPPTAPAPLPSQAVGRSGQDVAPQIVQGPAREALESAMPDPPATEAGSAVERSAVERSAGERHETGGPGAARPRRTGKPRPSAVPKRQHRHPAAELPALPKAPRTRAEVCELGARYGGWSRDSDQARICRSYG